MRAAFMAVLILFGLAADVVQANETQIITRKSDFVAAVNGKALELTRPYLARGSVKLRVTADGRITGTAMQDDVTGNWQWQGQYFCRVMRYGDENLERNCQVVTLRGNRVRFTADQGTGDWAEFALR